MTINVTLLITTQPLRGEVQGEGELSRFTADEPPPLMPAIRGDQGGRIPSDSTERVAGRQGRGITTIFETIRHSLYSDVNTCTLIFQSANFTGLKTLGTLLKPITITVASLLLFLFASAVYPQSSNEQSGEEKARKRALKQEAALNLWRLKKSIEEDAFYAGRVALNVWRSNAIDAGTFDQAQYDEFKQQLYEKSVMRSLECFEYYLAEQYFHDANMCLQTWKVHSQEIGLFEEDKYEELKERLKLARAQKAEEDKKRAEEKKLAEEKDNSN